jgi:hypothetical protein
MNASSASYQECALIIENIQTQIIENKKVLDEEQ